MQQRNFLSKLYSFTGKNFRLEPINSQLKTIFTLDFKKGNNTLTNIISKCIFDMYVVILSMFHRFYLAVVPFNLGQSFSCKFPLESYKINCLKLKFIKLIENTERHIAEESYNQNVIAKKWNSMIPLLWTHFVMVIWQQILDGSGVGVRTFCTVCVCVHSARVCVSESLHVCVCVWILFIFADDMYI